MKKILFSIITSLFVVSGWAQTTNKIGQYEEVGSISKELAEKISVYQDKNSFAKAIRSGEFVLSEAELKSVIESNKGKSLFKVATETMKLNYNPFSILAWVETYDDMWIKLSKEEAIEYWKIVRSFPLLFKPGVINVADIVRGEAAKYNIEPSHLDIGNVYTICKFSGENRDKAADSIYIPRLATFKYDGSYKRWFKGYLKRLPLKESKVIVSNELRAFIEKVDISNKAQNDWLTELRVFNTTYSEL